MISPHITIPYPLIGDYLSVIKEKEFNLEIYFTGNDLNNLQNTSISKLKEKLDYNPSISVHAPYMDLSPGAVDAEIRKVTEERFLNICEVAKELHSKAIVFHSGFEKWKYALNVDIWLRESIRTWEKIIKKLSDSNIKIAIENVFEDEPSNLSLLVKSIDSNNFGLCFDTGHFNLFSKIPLFEWLNVIKESILELHLHDNEGESDEHKAIGDGTFPFKTFFSEISDIDYLITLEAHSEVDIMKSIDSLNLLMMQTASDS